MIEYDYNQAHAALLKVDKGAFQSTKCYIESFELINFDGSQLMYLGFLSGFNQLTHMAFYQVYQLHKSLPTLPLLPKLAELKLSFSHLIIDGQIDYKISAFPIIIDYYLLLLDL